MNSEITIELKPSAQTELPSSVLNPGKRLRKAREQLRLSKEDISQQLKLKLHFIDAIENDDYAKMPALTFVKGYLRLYARAVNISGDEIIHSFNQLGLEEKQNHVSHQIFYSRQEAKQESNLRWATYIVVGVLVVLFVMWWFSEHGSSLPPPSAKMAQTITTTVTAPVVAASTPPPAEATPPPPVKPEVTSTASTSLPVPTTSTTDEEEESDSP